MGLYQANKVEKKKKRKPHGRGFAQSIRRVRPIWGRHPDDDPRRGAWLARGPGAGPVGRLRPEQKEKTPRDDWRMERRYPRQCVSQFLAAMTRVRRQVSATGRAPPLLYLIFFIDRLTLTPGGRRVDADRWPNGSERADRYPIRSASSPRVAKRPTTPPTQ